MNMTSGRKLDELRYKTPWRKLVWLNNMKNYSINLNQKNAKMPTDKSPSLKIEKKKPYVMPKVSNTGRGLGKY